MFEYNARDEGKPDELFLERLDTFMDKCMADMRAFSERELRPFEEVYPQESMVLGTILISTSA